MKLNSLSFRIFLFSIAALLCFLTLRRTTFAQNQQNAKSQNTVSSAKKSQNLKPVPRGKDMESNQEGADFLRRRQDWFFKPRAFPMGFIPQGARERALQQMREMYQREGRLSLSAAPAATGFVTPPTGTSSAWTDIGPQPTLSASNPPFTSGRVTALAANPNNANNVYLGGADGGLWVTTDGGNTWNPLAATDNPPNTGIPSIAVGALVVDPTTCGAAPSGICTTVYVGTGEDNFGGENIYGEGVLNCKITAGSPPTASCTQDSTFHSPSPLGASRGGPMIGTLAVNRLSGNNKILLAGVRGQGSAIVSGVYCSSDSGATWTRVLPTAANLVNGTGDPGTDVAFASDGTAWVALGFIIPTAANSIYKSAAPVTSCSITFTQQTLPPAFTANNIGRITLALAPSDNTKIYAAIADATTTSSTLLGVVRSTNATATTPTWTQLTDPLVSAAQGFCTGQCFYDMALSVDPASPDVVYAGGSGAHPIIRTTNGTAATPVWADVTAPTGTATVPHVDTHAFAFSNNGATLLVGNDGGVWDTNTPNSSVSWVNLNGPSTTSTGALDITQFYPGVSIHPANPAFAMGGTQDNEVQVDQAYLPGNGLLWQAVGIGCDGGFTAIDLAIPSTSYGECEYLPGAGFPFPVIAVTFSGDGILGNGFLANVGIDGNDRGGFIPPLVMDPSNTLTLYFATCRVWQTTDGANTWNAISPDVTSPSHPAGCPVPTAVGQPTAVLSTAAVAPNNSNTIYVGSDEGEIEVTSNGGTSWASIVTATLPTRAVTQIVVDPLAAGTAYAAFSGFGTCNNSAVTCDGKGHLFKTVNGTSAAATWVDISGTTTKLPDIPVNAIVIDPNDVTHNTLYVGTDIGAFFTTDGGVNWSPLGASNSIPNAQILSLTLHNPSRTLRAATHGRGVWDLNLGGLATFALSSINPFSVNAGSAATALTVNGNGFTSNSKIQLAINGTTTTLTPTSSTLPSQLVATIPQSALASGGLAQVSVTDSTQPTSPTNTLPFTILNPIPTVFSISPTSVTAGTNGLMLTVNGVAGSNSFVSGANGTVVLFNGFSKPTTFVNANQLTATLSASDLAAGGFAAIDTFTPQPGGGPDLNTNPPTLTINDPSPTLSSISPTTKVAGSAAFTLTVNGTGFVANSVVNFNGSAKSTTLVSSTQLTASILASDIATAGTDPVTVTNPAPGGGTTTAQNFTVTSSSSLTVSGSAATVTTMPAASGMATGTSTITVAGATAATTITCGSVPGVTCNPLSIPSGSTSGTLTINVQDPSMSMTAVNLPSSQNLWAATIPPSTHSNRAGWWTLSGGTGLAAILFLFLPKRKRYRVSLALGLVCLMTFALGCNNYGGGGGGGGGNNIPTTTHITVSSTKVPSSGANATITVSATVAANSGYGSTTPIGSIQFFDGGTPLGNLVSTTNGSTGNITLTPASAPPFFQFVGTHSVSARYLGDSHTLPSQSGTLNITLTGNTNLAITGASGGTNANANVSLTIN